MKRVLRADARALCFRFRRGKMIITHIISAGAIRQVPSECEQRFYVSFSARLGTQNAHVRRTPRAWMIYVCYTPLFDTS